MRATIRENRELTPGYFRLTLSDVSPVTAGKPGQFVMVRGDWKTDPLLPRPLSIYRFNKETDEIEIVFRVVGKGTKRLSETAPGRQVNLVGPLGRPFPTADRKKRMILVGGGIGVAPLMALAEAARGDDTLLIVGGKTKDDVLFVDRDVRRIPIDTVCATEDGSTGERGTAVSALSSRVTGDDVVYACGPVGMLKEVARLSGEVGFTAWVSLEERMACGIGACLGCAVKGTSGHYLHVCKDGPVFDAKDIAWDDL
jgi:dihydroorotate dehydrogenase electron transfer subunit